MTAAGENVRNAPLVPDDMRVGIEPGDRHRAVGLRQRGMEAVGDDQSGDDQQGQKDAHGNPGIT